MRPYLPFLPTRDPLLRRYIAIRTNTRLGNLHNLLIRQPILDRLLRPDRADALRPHLPPGFLAHRRGRRRFRPHRVVDLRRRRRSRVPRKRVRRGEVARGREGHDGGLAIGGRFRLDARCLFVLLVVGAELATEQRGLFGEHVQL